MRMQETNDIVELGDMLGRLRATDTSFRVLARSSIALARPDPCPKASWRRSSSTNRIRLPDDYRQFLAMIGNGGAGPFYGLEPLSTFGRDLSQPFPVTTATDALTDEDLERLPDER